MCYVRYFAFVLCRSLNSLVLHLFTPVFELKKKESVFVSYVCVINSLRIDNLKKRFFSLKTRAFLPHKVPF